MEIVLPYKNLYFPWPVAINFINQDLKKKNISNITNFFMSEDKIIEGKKNYQNLEFQIKIGLSFCM